MMVEYRLTICDFRVSIYNYRPFSSACAAQGVHQSTLLWFFSPGLRTKLASVREQLVGSQALECTSDYQSQTNEKGRSDDRLCPLCGQIMRKLKRIPAHADKPP